jgi:tRNA A37 methylthiotransferase MiaB
MKRDYTMQEFAWKVREIKKINPYALVATDIIVGFLDENDKDFAKTYDFLEKNFIDKFHVFRFSNRTNTASFYMKKRLSETPFIAKIQRARALADLSKKKYQLFLQKLIDKKYSSSALFLDKLENGHQQALLDNQVAIWVKTSNNLTGKIKNIQVVKLGINNLFGKII